MTIDAPVPLKRFCTCGLLGILVDVGRQGAVRSYVNQVERLSCGRRLRKMKLQKIRTAVAMADHSPKNWKSKRLKGRNEHQTSSNNGLNISTLTGSTPMLESILATLYPVPCREG